MSEKEIKRSVLDRIKYSVFRGDDFETYMRYEIRDSIKPAIGKALEGLASDIIRAIFMEEGDIDVRPRRIGRRSSRDDDYDYGRHSRKKKSRDSGSRRRDRDYDYDGTPSDIGPRETHLVPFKSRAEANEMIDFLVRRCKREGYVTVSEFYAEADVVSTNFANTDWGWTSAAELRRSRVGTERDGSWRLMLPKVRDIRDGGEEDDEEEED